MCRFSTFRRAILGLVAVISCLCIILSFCLLPYLNPKSSIWVMVGIPALAVVATLGSILRKPLLRSPQPVATEVAGIFILLPTELILAFFVLSIEMKSNSKTVQTFFGLQLLIFINDGVVFLYMAGLAITATITALVFDKNVWLRDVDSSPSPFPSSLLRGVVFSCLAPSLADSPSNSAGFTETRTVNCLPGCTCTRKPDGQHDSAGAQSAHSRSNADGSRSQSLIRVPDEFQRRSTILVAFEV